jgi:hypothetical protein
MGEKSKDLCLIRELGAQAFDSQLGDCAAAFGFQQVIILSSMHCIKKCISNGCCHAFSALRVYSRPDSGSQLAGFRVREVLGHIFLECKEI